MRREFQRRHVHIAIILGPKHSFVGIVTLEDLVEEVLGEIQDEQDAGEIPPIVRHRDGTFEVDGRLTLDVASRDLGVVFPPVPPQIEDELEHVPRRHRHGRGGLPNDHLPASLRAARAHSSSSGRGVNGDRGQ